MSAVRSRWAAIGAAIAISLGAGGGLGLVHATVSSGTKPVFIPITPCRIVDTRPALRIGPFTTPLGPGDTFTLDGRGTVGKCTIPSDAVALSMNMTAVGATAPTFLTVWPADAALPDASSLNPAPGAPPTPNAVTTNLSADGRFSIYNLAGRVHVLADVNGYYLDHNHDDRYYTKTQANDRYYTKTQSDDRYYTKTQSDDRYYTKTDTDNLANRVVSIVQGFAPAITMEFVPVSTETIVTPIDGRLMITKPFQNLQIVCSASTGTRYFLTLDGAPVPSSLQVTGNVPLTPAVMTGITPAPIAAGAHTIGVSGECTGTATVTNMSASNPGVLNVLILN